MVSSTWNSIFKQTKNKSYAIIKASTHILREGVKQCAFERASWGAVKMKPQRESGHARSIDCLLMEAMGSEKNQRKKVNVGFNQEALE